MSIVSRLNAMVYCLQAINTDQVKTGFVLSLFISFFEAVL